MIDVKRRLYGELKRFAHAERAREFAKRHGRKFQLPWDPAEDAGTDAKDIDQSILADLAGSLGG